MPASLATLEAVTKEVFGPKLEKQLNDEVVALKRIKRDSDGITDEISGKYVSFPIHVKRNSGIGARGENEALPSPGQQGTTGARVGLKYQYGAMELTGQAIRLVDKNYNSFVKAVEFESDRLRVDLSRDLNRQVYGDGTGTLAKCTAGGPINTITVDDPYLIDEDMVIDIVESTTDAVLAAGRTVTAINIAAKTVTISGAAVTVTANHVFTRKGNWKREWTGFKAIINDSGILYNVNPATYSVWKANVDRNGGTPRSVSEGLFNVMTDTIKDRGSKVTAAYTTVGVRRAYANLLQTQRHYVNTNGKFDGGYTGLAYQTPEGEIPLVTDAMAPKTKIWWVNEDDLTLYREGEWEFMNYGGGDKWVQKQVAGETYDAYVARLFQYSEIGCHRRGSHGLIEDLQEA